MNGRTGHSFNFNGGEKLNRMGATWFVSYYYYSEKDSSHINWKNVKTANNRIGVFRITKCHHRYWLERVLEMRDDYLKRSTIGVTPEQTKRMARELLGK